MCTIVIMFIIIIKAETPGGDRRRNLVQCALNFGLYQSQQYLLKYILLYGPRPKLHHVTN